MFSKLVKALRHQEKSPYKIILREDGFDLHRGEEHKGEVSWDEVDKIVVFKKDMLTFDIVCVEFTIGVKDQFFLVDDDVEGFWDMVRRIKEVFLKSNQKWEELVIKPAFDQNLTVIYERTWDRKE